MNIYERTISALAKVITGDSKISPYRSGRELIKFFNELGANDVYNSDFGSRVPFTERKIRELNGNPNLSKVFNSALDQRNFLETEFQVEQVVDYLNQYLKYDKYEIVKFGMSYGVRNTQDSLVKLELPFTSSPELYHNFIEEQIQKCDQKILESDFDGAITNARSLLEAVLLEIESKLNVNPPQHDGDLTKLYNKIKPLLNLDPSQKDISNTLKQILSGLVSIVSGLAGLRNKMSDSHALTYKPQKHHAKLAVNAAKTMADFIFEVFSYQLSKGKISVPTTQVSSKDTNTGEPNP